MVKGKKRPNSNDSGNSKKNYIKSVMESAKSQKKKADTEREESARQRRSSL